MKRSALKRSASSLRRTPMKRRPRRARPGKDDEAYLRWIRRLPCCGPGCMARGPSHAHHATGAGMARQASDRDAMPLCPACHRQLHEFTGRFKDWSRHQRGAWQREQIVQLLALYARQRAM